MKSQFTGSVLATKIFSIFPQKQSKTQKTRSKDIELAKTRYNAILKEVKS